MAFKKKVLRKVISKKSPQFQIVQLGGNKKIMLKPGSQFTLEILNQVVQMFNEVIDEKRVEKKVLKVMEDNNEVEVEKRDPHVGPITMQMETNISLVEDIFKQNSESQEEETDNKDNLVAKDEEENDFTDQS